MPLDNAHKYIENEKKFFFFFQKIFHFYIVVKGGKTRNIFEIFEEIRLSHTP
jgi:hypothetical protein